MRNSQDLTQGLFLGVHSIERSAQEDTLLVLFNTAISNLVSANVIVSLIF